jgi:hypothetical protein
MFYLMLRTITLTLALIFPMALFSVVITKRQKLHPVRYMWLARTFCVMPILTAGGIVCAAIYHGQLTGFAAGLQTGLNGGAMLLLFYAALIACGRREIADVIKASDWKRET